MPNDFNVCTLHSAHRKMVYCEWPHMFSMPLEMYAALHCEWNEIYVFVVDWIGLHIDKSEYFHLVSVCLFSRHRFFFDIWIKWHHFKVHLLRAFSFRHPILCRVWKVWEVFCWHAINNNSTNGPMVYIPLTNRHNTDRSIFVLNAADGSLALSNTHHSHPF